MMVTDNNNPEQLSSRSGERLHIKAEASRIAKEQVSSLMWNLQIVIFAYAISIAAVIMAFKGVRIEIIAACSIVGLSVIWICGRIRHKKLYRRLYQNEIRHLQELAYEEKFSSLKVLNNQVTEKAAVAHSVTSPLTPRQREIMMHIASGYSNKQIAARLKLSECTIKNQLGYIYKKLNVENRTQAVLVSIQKGCISPEMDRYHPPAVTVISRRSVYEPEIN